jgi:LPS export ABC transporter protein LptC
MMFRIKQPDEKSLFCKIAGLLILALSLPGVTSANKDTVSGAEEESDQQINDFSLAGYGESGKKTWEIFGKSADIFKDIVKLKQIVGNLYDEKENIKLTADKGDFDKEKGTVHLEQNVIITTSAGAKLTTDSLLWDRLNQLVSTEDKVNIERQDMHLVAQGASGRPDLNEVILEKDVQMNILPAEQASGGLTKAQETIITCDGPLQIDYQKNVATFNNNVKVDRQGMQISSDIMEVYFITSSGEKEPSPQVQDASMPLGGKIDKIVARGNVKITRGENVSYSEEATYSALDKKIILSGRPKLIIYSKGDTDASSGN